MSGWLAAVASNTTVASGPASGSPSHADATTRLLLTVAIVAIASLSALLAARLCRRCLDWVDSPDDCSEVSDHTRHLLRLRRQHRRCGSLSEAEKATWRGAVLAMWWRSCPAEEAVSGGGAAEAAERQADALRRLRDAWLKRCDSAAAAAGKEPASTAERQQGPLALAHGTMERRPRQAWLANARLLAEVNEVAAAAEPTVTDAASATDALLHDPASRS